MAVVIGITGGIATGKSTVLDIFRKLGAQTLSADTIAHEILTKGSPAYCEVIERFGKDVLDLNGEIDRARLAKTIFENGVARKTLEEITHPRIISQMKRHIDDFRASHLSPHDVLAVEIPLLYEAGLESIVDKVVVVAAEQETQLNRLTTRSGISKDEALRRIESQMPIERKIKSADWVIWNEGNLHSLEESVKHIWDEILLP